MADSLQVPISTHRAAAIRARSAQLQQIQALFNLLVNEDRRDSDALMLEKGHSPKEIARYDIEDTPGGPVMVLYPKETAPAQP